MVFLVCVGVVTVVLGNGCGSEGTFGFPVRPHGFRTTLGFSAGSSCMYRLGGLLVLVFLFSGSPLGSGSSRICGAGGVVSRSSVSSSSSSLSSTVIRVHLE